MFFAAQNAPSRAGRKAPQAQDLVDSGPSTDQKQSNTEGKKSIYVFELAENS